MLGQLSGVAGEFYEKIKGAPIVSPHGHCNPAWFSRNNTFDNPAELLVVPDHYVFRMLYSQGINLTELGIGVASEDRDSRLIFQTLGEYWHLFLGTPSHTWMTYVLEKTIGCKTPLGPNTSSYIYDQIAEWITDPSNTPRSLFDRFNIEVLATTDGALDTLEDHLKISQSDWSGRVIPTFRPDAVLNPLFPGWIDSLRHLGQLTSQDTQSFSGYIQALRIRRKFFQSMGATATDHAVEAPELFWLEKPSLVFDQLINGDNTDAMAFHGHMLIEMSQMSIEDGLVMQLHAGSKRNTNEAILNTFGYDMGADIPVSTDWVRGLGPLLNRVGNNKDLTLILFTLDETSYARELAPMAGHWPCLKIGPPWWFHDSAAGIARYFDQVVETAGYWNLAGFNDDTRAFLSIPARHDLWRRGVSVHLAEQITKQYFSKDTAEMIAELLVTGLARNTYKLR